MSETLQKAEVHVVSDLKNRLWLTVQREDGSEVVRVYLSNDQLHELLINVESVYWDSASGYRLEGG